LFTASFFVVIQSFGLISISEFHGVNLYSFILIQGPLIALVNFSQNILKWTFSRSYYVLLTLGLVFFQAIALLIAVNVMAVNVEYVLMINAIGYLFFGVLGIILVRKWLIFPPGMRYIKELIYFATPLWLICILLMGVPAFDRFMIERFLGPGELGLYAAASKMAMLLSMIVGSFQTAWGPFSIALFRQENASETYNLVLKIFSFITCLAVMVLDLIAMPALSILTGGKFNEAAVLVFPLSMILAIQAVGFITEIGIGFSKKTRLNLYAQILYLIILGIFVYPFLKLYGLLGICYVAMFAQIVKSLYGSISAQKVHPLKWRYWPAIAMLAFTFFSWIITSKLALIFDYYLLTLIRIFTILLFFCFSWVFFLSKYEKMGIKNYLLKTELIKS
jgi:O-antigen/teichoic acid export membrane protein